MLFKYNNLPIQFNQQWKVLDEYDNRMTTRAKANNFYKTRMGKNSQPNNVKAMKNEKNI